MTPYPRTKREPGRARAACLMRARSLGPIEGMGRDSGMKPDLFVACEQRQDECNEGDSRNGVIPEDGGLS